MDNLNQEINYYVYEIKDSSINKNNRCLVKSKIKPQDINDLIFNINIRVLFHNQI